MTWKLILAVMAIAFQAACQTRIDAPVAVTIYGDGVLNGVKQYSETIHKKRGVIEFESGLAAETCETYSRLIKEAVPKEGVSNQIAKSDYLICDVLEIIGNKKYREGARENEYGHLLAARLDLRSFSSSLFQRLGEKKFAFNHFDAGTVKTNSTSVTYETPDWHYKLEIVAVLDLNNNGKPDWVMWLADEAKVGNYRNYQTLVAYDVATEGAIRATPFPRLAP
ncbi:MAG: hypothetical protein HZA59_00585 [Hydrogenophilales bacterium]|nr:hypothetical protein [Hydrogenophilales bacterium]